MAANLTIRATVVDIRVDQPRISDLFLIDTNVWRWFSYSRVSSSSTPWPYQTTYYPKYLRDAKTIGARLFWCGLSLSELTHQIEKCEWEIFKQVASKPQLTLKEYRHNHPLERVAVLNQIDSAWSQIAGFADPLPCTVDEPVTTAALQDLQNMAVDGYDLFMLQAAVAAGVSQILTDDGDYTTVAGITVFTANKNVVDTAKAQGMLQRR